MIIKRGIFIKYQNRLIKSFYIFKKLSYELHRKPFLSMVTVQIAAVLSYKTNMVYSSTNVYTKLYIRKIYGKNTFTNSPTPSTHWYSLLSPIPRAAQARTD